jgi:exosortase N
MKLNNIAIIYPTYRLTHLYYQYKKLSIPCLFILSYLVVFSWFLSKYFITDYTIWASILLSPYIIAPSYNQAGNFKYLYLAAVFSVFTFVSGVQTFYFLAIGLAILFVLESMVGSVGYLPLYLLGLISPTFKYFNNMLGFPVRLKLSECTGKILGIMGYKIEVMGNVIVKNGTEFSVDPACVGLKMIAISILTGLLIMAYHQRQTSKSFNFIISAGVLLIITGFNIIANLIRITILTIFEVLPGNPYHDIVGIICFLLYVIVPSYFLIKWIAGRIHKKEIENTHNHCSFRNIIIINLLLLAVIITIGCIKHNKEKITVTAMPQISLKDYTKEIVKGDVLKLEKPGILLYIKPLSKFYGAEHNPMICWTGSGYQFARINKQFIEGKEIYTGLLKKGTEVIYSAWWFDNGSYRTIEQADWRWRALKGENFFLVNINSDNEKMLKAEIKKLLITYHSILLAN